MNFCIYLKYSLAGYANTIPYVDSRYNTVQIKPYIIIITVSYMSCNLLT